MAFILFLLSDVAPGGLGLGEPWDSLLKGAGGFLVLLILGLMTERLYLPNVVKDREKRIEELQVEKETQLKNFQETLESERVEARRRLQEAEVRLQEERANTKETFQWLRDEAIPLVSKSADLIEKLTEQRSVKRAAPR